MRETFLTIILCETSWAALPGICTNSFLRGQSALASGRVANKIPHTQSMRFIRVSCREIIGARYAGVRMNDTFVDHASRYLNPLQAVENTNGTP